MHGHYIWYYSFGIDQASAWLGLGELTAILPFFPSPFYDLGYAGYWRLRLLVITSSALSLTLALSFIAAGISQGTYLPDAIQAHRVRAADFHREAA